MKSLRQEYDILIGERKFQAEVLLRLPYYHQEQLFYDGDVYLKQTYNGENGVHQNRAFPDGLGRPRRWIRD